MAQDRTNQTRWSDVEKEYVFDNWKHTSDSEMSETLNRSRVSVKKFRERNGLLVQDGKQTQHQLCDIYLGMIQRCSNIKCPAYKYYGGRGIRVCDRWTDRADGFWNFVEDVGERPDGYQLDRVDNSLGYSPGNVRWATRIQNCNNTRQNVHCTLWGETKTISQWIRDDRICVSRDTAGARMNQYGWSKKDALTIPVGRRRKWTLKDKEEIMSMIDRGCSHKYIADVYGVKTQTITSLKYQYNRSRN